MDARRAPNVDFDGRDAHVHVRGVQAAPPRAPSLVTSLDTVCGRSHSTQTGGSFDVDSFLTIGISPSPTRYTPRATQSHVSQCIKNKYIVILIDSAF